MISRETLRNARDWPTVVKTLIYVAGTQIAYGLVCFILGFSLGGAF